MKFYIFIMAVIFTSLSLSQTKYPDINREMDKGNFKKAASMIHDIIAGDETLTLSEKYDLSFQLEKMDRIRKDFRRDRQYVVNALKKYYPALTDEMMSMWEKSKVLEMMIIDGEKKYFNNAVPNLFRIDKNEQEIRNKVDGTPKRELDDFLAKHIPLSIEKIKAGGDRTGNPVKMIIDYTITVDSDAVPDGEMIRCWMPYPREGWKRQSDISLLSVNDPVYTIADKNNLQRTIYIQKPAKKGIPTVFNFKLSYVCSSQWQNIVPEMVKPYVKSYDLYKENTTERPPHIVFTDELKELSKKIVGDERNPYLIAKKIFTWIDENIPWASAREYSTLDNIPVYCYENKHGDCGIQTLLFMTLARMNGIPAKWQSGWMMHPPEVNLHDWCEIFLEGYGWVPVDQSFGMQKSTDEQVKYFYLGGIDSYRLIVNDDYTRDLYPAKIYPRSETVDFQRGEVEWKGGNLYFDKWDYNMKVEYSQ